MHIESVQIQGVRNLERVVINPNKKINIFTGKNASGKTSFLEAIHILARSKSFRTPRIKDVINYHQTDLAVTAKINHEYYKPLKLQITKGGRTNALNLNNEKVNTVSELAKILPIITITQDSQQIITGPPKQRRHWLDWAMFHVEPDYLLSWKQYFRALRQRNILLKRGERKEEIYRPWEGEMIKLAEYMTQQRKGFVHQISLELGDSFNSLNTEKVAMKFKQGWPDGAHFGEYLQGQRTLDQKRGHTRGGPHQADILFQSKDEEINKIFSRGQIKIYINQLLVTQARVTSKTRGVKPIILVDDYKAELDKNNSEHLLNFIKNQEYQSFITTTEREESDQDISVFHVEHGSLS